MAKQVPIVEKGDCGQNKTYVDDPDGIGDHDSGGTYKHEQDDLKLAVTMFLLDPEFLLICL